MASKSASGMDGRLEVKLTGFPSCGFRLVAHTCTSVRAIRFNQVQSGSIRITRDSYVTVQNSELGACAKIVCLIDGGHTSQQQHTQKDCRAAILVP